MISVAMATYNGSSFLEQQLLSILNQERKVDEVIICDDGSSDDTVELVCSFIAKYSLKSWKIIQNPERLGLFKNFLQAIQLTGGDIIFLSDQDDVWDLSKVSKMCAIMEENEDILSLCCDYSTIDSDENIIKESCDNINGEIEYFSFGDIVTKFGFLGMAMAFRSNIKDYIEKFDLEIELVHDWYINIIAANLGGSYKTNSILCSHRVHSSNFTPKESAIRSNADVRLMTLHRDIEYYEFAKHVLTFFQNEPSCTESNIYFLNTKIQVYNDRISAISSHKMFKLIKLLRYINYYPSLKAYVGDVLYTSRLIRFMHL